MLWHNTHVMKNKTRYILWSAITVIVILAVLTGVTKSNDNNFIKIGAVYPLTGQFSTYGIEYKRGIELAVKEINGNGGVDGKRLEVLFEDDWGDVTKSVSAVQKLINIDEVRYLFTAFSSQSLASAPVAEQNKVLYITATVSRVGTGNYVFRDYWDMEEVGRSIGQALNNDGMKKVGIMAVNFGDTEVFLAGLKSEAVSSQFLDQMFSFGDLDFKTQMAKIKSFNPDAIVVYGFPGSETINITKQLKVFGLDNKRLYSGSTVYVLPFMYEQFKETLVKMRVVDNNYDLDSNNIKAIEFQKNYKIAYGVDLLIADATYAYDDVYALKWALEKSKDINNTKEVADNLRQIKMNGAAGELSFDNLGNSNRKTYLQTYTKDGWVKY